MKTFKYIFIAFLLSLYGCKKDAENLDVDLSKYNSDKFIPGDEDYWIKENLTTPYNIEVIYRFDRGMGDVARNISPPRMDRVIPSGKMILDGFLKVYENVAGPTFIKTYTPKQFVFWGSLTYNTNGTVTLGTADGGRRVVLYDVNNLNENDPENIKRRLRTVHHEFTHILNQLVSIPPSFERITPGDYESDWTGFSAAAAQQLGFISQYARSEYTEDFAEMVAHLLVEGQLYFDRYAEAAGTDGKAKLKQKEAVVVDYFKQYFDIDFRELQYEVYQMLHTKYNDQTETASNQFKLGHIKTVPVDFVNGAHYANYGKSNKFQLVWDNVIQALAEVPTSNPTPRQARLFTLNFISGTQMRLEVAYGSTEASTSNTIGYLDFTVNYATNGDIDFTYVPNVASAGAQYNNALVTIAGWQPLIDFLNDNTFQADWIPESAGLVNFRKFAGFQLKDDPTNYFYGPITLN